MEGMQGTLEFIRAELQAATVLKSRIAGLGGSAFFPSESGTLYLGASSASRGDAQKGSRERTWTWFSGN